MERNDNINNEIPSGRTLVLGMTSTPTDRLEEVTKALGSDKRLAILQLLGKQTCSVLDIAQALHLPQSTATLHINILEKAGLIKTDLQPAKRGLQKLCARVYDRIIVQLPSEHAAEDRSVSISMPLGGYVEAQVSPTCGLASEHGLIGYMDEPASFFEPARINAQLIWFRSGYIEYRFPNRLPPNSNLQSLEVSFEACSEAPLHHNNWPSDITVWINQVEIGTWTSPADFGGERGMLTPSWWDSSNSQFGLHKIWRLTEDGCLVDGMPVSSVRLKDVPLNSGELISVRIGIRPDAHNVGGINLFGSKFGNYPEDLVLKMSYRYAGKEVEGIPVDIRERVEVKA